MRKRSSGTRSTATRSRCRPGCPTEFADRRLLRHGQRDKFKDPNLDGEQTGSEGTLSGWEFTLTGGNAPVVQSTGANGTTSFSVDANQAYEVCETDDRLGGTAGVAEHDTGR